MQFVTCFSTNKLHILVKQVACLKNAFELYGALDAYTLPFFVPRREKYLDLFLDVITLFSFLKMCQQILNKTLLVNVPLNPKRRRGILII